MIRLQAPTAHSSAPSTRRTSRARSVSMVQVITVGSHTRVSSTSSTRV
ncbi:hypothetical protein [Deinococcus multiflagellatus]|uniref:Uncharacterized protein n=1 Tax=Deinococcus multiflagellatus TaxID=1656887 RepID=A0ABW1ZJT8_9DEIO